MTIPGSLRMAVLGCGRMGRVHARAICGSPHAALVAVCDTQPERADKAAHDFGASRFLEYRNLLREMQLDAVTIATPSHLHLEPALTAIEAGLAVFCEKPLAPTRDEAQRIVDAADQSAVRLAVNYNRRYGFGYRKAKELVAADRIGSLRHALLHVTDQYPPAHVVRSPEILLTNLLSHHLDLLRWFCGEFATVSAQLATDQAQQVVRDAALSFTCADGVIATLVGGYRDRQTRTRERMELIGTSGQLTVEDVTQAVSLFTDDPDHVQMFRPNSFLQATAFYETIAAHLRDFIEGLRDNRPLAVTGRDGLRGLEIAEAALMSQQEQRPIKV